MTNLRDVVLANPKVAARQSWSWYQKNIRQAAGAMSAQKFLGDNQPHQTKRIVPGQMLSFFYDPKTKEKLPYYDTFPLIFPWAVERDRFYGLNLHYISPRLRLVLLEKLMKISGENISNTKKIAFSWQTIKGMSELPQAKHCVKQYLFGHVKSNFILIPQSDWRYVIWLPLERFKKASAEEVWAAA